MEVASDWDGGRFAADVANAFDGFGHVAVVEQSVDVVVVDGGASFAVRQRQLQLALVVVVVA